MPKPTDKPNGKPDKPPGKPPTEPTEPPIEPEEPPPDIEEPPPDTTEPPGEQRMLTPQDLRYEGALRLEVVLGSGGTGNLGLTGGMPTFYAKANGKVGLLMLGERFPEYYPTGHPLVEWEIDPTVLANPEMSAAPHMKYIRTWGDIRDGHIITCAGYQQNFYAGSAFYERRDDNTGWLWWTTNDGYVPQMAWPELSCTVLHHDTGAFESYGPWLIDKAPHGHRRFCTGGWTQLAPAFVAAHCPGFSKAMTGQMGSGALECPFGASLTVIEDFDPTTRPPATGPGQPPQVQSKSLIMHDSMYKQSRDTRYNTCGWGDPNNPDLKTYDCRLGQPIFAGVPVFGGHDTSLAEVDGLAWVTWIDTPTIRGLLYGGALSRTPEGYMAPGDPQGYVHHWYGSALHGTETGSGYPDQHCCHGQPAPNWGSTGPGAHFRQPMGWIYDPQHVANVKGLGGSTDPWALTPTTDAFEWAKVCSSLNIHPPKDVHDWEAIFDWGSTGWVHNNKLYALGMRDFTTGYRLPCVFVFQLP